MKNLFLLGVILLLNLSCFAQNTNTLFLTYALSNPKPLYNKSVDGGAGYKSVASNTFGLRYHMKSAKIITLETGIDYAVYHFKLNHVDDPNVPISDAQQTAKLISIPVYAHLTFLRYLFINGGLLVDTEINKQRNDVDKQTGIGFGLGAGVKFTIRNLSVFVNPFLERHAYIGIGDSHPGTRQSMANAGGRIGIGYAF